MFQSWLQPIEQVMLAAVDSKVQVLGIFSPDRGSGVSAVCLMLAECHSRTGTKTLLIDLSQTIEHSDDDLSESEAWAPGDGAAQLIQSHKGGFDVLAVRPSSRTRPMFNNVDVLRRMFKDELAAYEAIVVDLPPVLNARENRINPLAAARACDAVVMVCMIGMVTHQRVKATLSMLQTAGIQLGGTLANELHNPTLAYEMSAYIRRFAGIAPRFSAWIERKLMSSQVLNHQT